MRFFGMRKSQFGSQLITDDTIQYGRCLSGTGLQTARPSLTDDVSVEDDRVFHERPHRGGSVALLHQDVSGAVVDVLEAIRAQQNPAVPARHDHHDVTDVQNLRKRGSEGKTDSQSVVFF